MGEKSRVVAPGVGAAVVVALALSLGIAAPAQASGRTSASDPTWAEVQAAKRNAAAAAQELGRIQTAVGRLQQQEDAASAAALDAAYRATLAANALQAAQAKLASLDDQLATARSHASAASARFVATQVQLDRIGGATNLTTRLLASGGGSRDLLGRLSALDQLGRRSSRLEDAARQRQNVVDALERQATTAERLRTSLKADADTELQTAQAAQAAAQATLDAGRQRLSVLGQQAAYLGGQAQSLSAAYARGQPAKARPAAGGSSGGGSSGGGHVGTIDTSGVVANPAAAKAYAQQAIGRYGWGSDQYQCLLSLWTVESGWRANAYNPSSGAYGIPQALPAAKMASAGADWLTNGNTQIDWGLSYIRSSYRTPGEAWAFETSHVPYWY